MNLPGFVSDHDVKSFGVRPAAGSSRRCSEQYDRCMEKCSDWPDPGVCACYCDNDRCRCNNPNCPAQLCE